MHDDDLDALTDIASRPRSRTELAAEFGQVWDEDELNREFATTAIIPPAYIVRRRSDNVVGRVLCQPQRYPHPRLFFRFRPSPPTDPA